MAYFLSTTGLILIEATYYTKKTMCDYITYICSCQKSVEKKFEVYVRAFCLGIFPRECVAAVIAVSCPPVGYLLYYKLVLSSRWFIITYLIIQQAVLLTFMYLLFFLFFGLGLGSRQVTISKLQAVINSHPEEQFS